MKQPKLKKKTQAAPFGMLCRLITHQIIDNCFYPYYYYFIESNNVLKKREVSMLTELETALAKVTIEEETLVFDSFTGADAWELGQILVQLGKNAQMPVAVNISACGRQLFHYSFDGASPDNDNWIIRKQNVVLRFLKSSWRMALQLKLNGTTYPERYGISSEIYAASGGAFPITVRNVGVIGAVTVSGLKDYEDHDLVVAAINIFLEKYPNR